MGYDEKMRDFYEKADREAKDKRDSELHAEGRDEAREAYLKQPANFGSESFEVSLAETDAFNAGWESARKYFASMLAESSF